MRNPHFGLANVARILECTAIVLAGLGVTADEALGQTTANLAIQGAWEPQVYVLKDGTRHALRGRIFFTASEWLVTFFVIDHGKPRRGSSEGGRYKLEGDSLILRHSFLLAAGDAMPGLPASPLQMEARTRDEPVEGTSIKLENDRLVLYFPSGNSMEFKRSTSSTKPRDN